MPDATIFRCKRHLQHHLVCNYFLVIMPTPFFIVLAIDAILPLMALYYFLAEDHFNKRPVLPVKSPVQMNIAEWIKWLNL